MSATPQTTPATSSSTPDGTPKPSTPVRMQVRERQQGEITAYQLLQDEPVLLSYGHGVHARRGEWIICRGGVAVDLLNPAMFALMYEPLVDPGLVVSPDDRTALEAALGFGATSTSSSLRSAVTRLVHLQIGKVDVTFTVTQWEEIARRAEKRRLTVPQYMQQIIDKLTTDIWTSAI